MIAADPTDRLLTWGLCMLPRLVGSDVTAGCTPTERQALYYSQLGLSTQDVAALMGVSPGAVRMYVSRAIARVETNVRPSRRVWCQGTPDTWRGA